MGGMGFTAYTEREGEEKLRGVIPQHYSAYRLFKVFRVAAILFAVLTLILFILGFTNNRALDLLTGSNYYNTLILILLGISGASCVFMLILYVLFLRKPPFDTWVYEVAQKRLGTEVIYYNSKCLYIGYDVAAAKEVDKRDFVTEMSDKSDHYSYFYVDTFVDQQIIQVECTRRQPIPERASFDKDDDLFWNIIPIGLTINNVTQSVSPIGWWLNDNNKDERLVATVPSTSILIAGGTGSGKSVLEQAIVGHVSRYPDRFQLVGIDCKRVEFNLLRGVKGVKGVALDVKSAADIATSFQRIMMDRFKFMELQQVNNIYKIKDKEVDYYELWGQKFQFDEMFELMLDITEESAGRDYDKLMTQYPEGRQPKILTIESIYNGLKKGEFQNPQLPEVKGYNSYITLDDIKKTKGIFTPKALLLLADELNELMTSDDYKSVDAVKQALGSIARLGRAAGVHLALACQRASGSTISTDLKNNIQQSVLLGGFDSGASTLMFEKDISNLAKPEIKGRAFMQSGNDIKEVQTYYTQPEKDWVFDENQKLTYMNPEFQKQKYGKVLTEDEVNELLGPEGFIVQKQKTEDEISKVDEDDQDIDLEDISEDDFNDELEDDIEQPENDKKEEPIEEERKKPTFSFTKHKEINEEHKEEQVTQKFKEVVVEEDNEVEEPDTENNDFTEIKVNKASEFNYRYVDY